MSYVPVNQVGVRIWYPTPPRVAVEPRVRHLKKFNYKKLNRVRQQNVNKLPRGRYAEYIRV